MSPDKEPIPIPDPRKLQPEGLSNKAKRYIFFGIFGVVSLVVLVNALSGPAVLPTAPAKPQPSTAKQQQGNPTAAQLTEYSRSLEQQQAMLLEKTRADAANLERLRASQGQITADDLQKAAALHEAATMQQQYRQQQAEQAQTRQGKIPEKVPALDSLIRQDHAQTSPVFAPWQHPQTEPITQEAIEERDAAGPIEGPTTNATATTPGTKARKALDFDPARKTYYLPEGFVIEAVLTNRLVGDQTGPVNALVTADVFLPGTRLVVIPQGSRVLGEASKVTLSGQQRLAVAFHRIMIPGLHGYSIPLDVKPPALAQGGETGLRDKVNSHYAQIFGTSLAIGAIGGLAQIGNGQSGFGYDPSVQFRNGITQSTAQTSERILDKFLNRLPTLEIRPGTRTRILLTDDLNLPAYMKEATL